MGIREISVYNPALEYDRPLKLMAAGQQEENKRYHVGYVAGVFDLFHIGHLNLLKRAKEQCDYLIVGVVSDEQVIRDKRTSPYVPFEERKEIVQSCKYVDEAVRIPEDHPGTEEAYRRYHFDAQFSGSDYENDPDWMAKREYLRQHGSELVFSPIHSLPVLQSSRRKSVINRRKVYMQISYSPVGSVDIWRPNRGLEQLVSAGIKSTIWIFRYLPGL